MTRGVFGLRYQERDRLQYCDSDSYPDALGQTAVALIKLLSDEELEQAFDRMIEVDADDAIDTSMWALAIKDKCPIKYYHANYFIRDSLMCEYGYVVNLDLRALEFYVGFQLKSQSTNRYGAEITRHGQGSDMDYYPCKLAGVFSFDEIRSCPSDMVIHTMNNLADEEADETDAVCGDLMHEEK